jgi:hypothetical protein
MAVLFGVQLFPVVAAAIASMVVGMLWYGPLFGKEWMKLMKISPAKMKQMGKSAGNSYFYAFVAALISAFVLSIFINFANATTIGEGAVIGVWAWLGFIATTTLNSVLWEGKSENLYLLNNSHQLVNFAVMGAILVAL